MLDPVGAFILRHERRTHTSGPLAGLTFGVKDLFDVSGLPTGAGSPAWLDTHPIPNRTASCVTRLLDAGAQMRGKTHTDEHAYASGRGRGHQCGCRTSFVMMAVSAAFSDRL
jgi:amidase